MANTILTHRMIAREAAKMLVEQANLIKNINTGRSSEFKEAVNGYKKGGTVDIGVPPVPVVYDGTVFAGGGAAPGLEETKVTLTLDTQKHVPLTFTAQEKLLELTEFNDRFLKPAMQSLISTVQADLLNRFVNKTPNLVGTAGSVPTTRRVYGQARAGLERFLAPVDSRTVLFSSDANLELSEANSTLFHDSTEIKAEFDDGAVGRYGGFNFYENQSLPVHLNGAGAAYLVNGAGQTGNALVVDGGTGPVTKGTVFSIAGVYAVHPITGLTNGQLRQFVVTADYAGGAGSLPIYPALVASSQTQIGTVNALPADNAPVAFVGAASTGYRQNLAFQKNAFTAAFAPLPVLASCEGYTATIQGVSVRVMTGGDFKNDMESTRIDVLYGEAAVRPDHAVRITE